MARPHELPRLIDVELHAIEFPQQVVRKLDVRLVDLVDEQDWLDIRLKGLPDLPFEDVVGDVSDARLAELRVAQARDRIVLV